MVSRLIHSINEEDIGLAVGVVCFGTYVIGLAVENYLRARAVKRGLRIREDDAFFR